MRNKITILTKQTQPKELRLRSNKNQQFLRSQIISIHNLQRPDAKNKTGTIPQLKIPHKPQLFRKKE